MRRAKFAGAVGSSTVLGSNNLSQLLTCGLYLASELVLA